MAWRKPLFLFRLSFSRHTDSVVNSFSEAWKLAQERQQAFLTPKHILAGMIAVSTRCSRSIFRRYGLELDALTVMELIGDSNPGASGARVELDADSRTLLVLAGEHARSMGHNYIGTEHILLALLTGPSRVAEFLRTHGLEYSIIKASIGTGLK